MAERNGPKTTDQDSGPAAGRGNQGVNESTDRKSNPKPRHPGTAHVSNNNSEGRGGHGGYRGGRGASNARDGRGGFRGGISARGGRGGSIARGGRGGSNARGGGSTRGGSSAYGGGSTRGGSSARGARGDSSARGGNSWRGGSWTRGSRGAAHNVGTHPRNQGTWSPGVCRSFLNTGTCSYGNRCRFTHTTSGQPSPAARNRALTSRLPEASRAVVDFVERLNDAVCRRSFRLSLEDPRQLDLWLQSWAAVAVGAKIKGSADLVRALLRLPASSAILPPATDILSALIRIVADTVTATPHSKATVVEVLQLVADTVENRLLQHEKDVPHGLRATCTQKVGELRKAAHAGLFGVIRDLVHSERASSLLGRILALLDRYVTELRRAGPQHDGEVVDSGETDIVDKPWAGWRSATLSWLLRGMWLAAPQLLREYDNVEAYTETLRQLVTMLTFYWGAGAVFPKCCHRGHDNRPCAQPLCANVANKRQKACGRPLRNGRTCTEQVQWRCSRHGHDVACDRCLRQLQQALIDKPGPRASTDVYDAVVERETLRRDGFVYILSQLASRKPPSIDPNWKTTYRLKCSGLIGVMRLGASCEPLSPRSRLEWAEIVPISPQSGAAPDFMERSRGRLAVRLLTRADLSTLNTDAETLDPGTRVAVLDLQVFVPEVLSVLSTVTDPEFVDHLKQLPFSKGLIGDPSLYQPRKCGDDAEGAISHALSTTEIELLTKLQPNAKAMLCEKLVCLARDANLYGTQLEAFSAALTTSLHCTQGPPGTGKSYVGVVLIHALDLIRQYAVKAGHVVGPIVVLSYKNHALDELLLDVLKGCGERSGLNRGLIRCGKSEDERLLRFGERNSLEEKKRQEVLRSRVACVRSVQRTLRDWRILRDALKCSAIDDEQAHELRIWKPSRTEKTEQNTVKDAVMKAVFVILRVDELPPKPDSAEAYALLQNVVNNLDEELVDEQHELLSAMAGLAKDIEHWLEPGDIRPSSFLLENWLNGARPPPRCAASKENGGCLMKSTSPDAYCSELHDCKYQFPCPQRRMDGRLFCEMHCCKAFAKDKPCPYPLIEDSIVCKRHACQLCVKWQCSPIVPIDVMVCKEHACGVEACDEKQLAVELPFCVQHSCQICRNPSTPGGVSQIMSVKRIQGSDYCKEHKCIVRGCAYNRLLGDTFQDYCRRHACTACEGRRSLVDPGLPPSRFCREHRCSNVDRIDGHCYLKRQENSLFCDGHTCYICREKYLPLDRKVVDSPPRNVCPLHPLCANISRDAVQCNNRAIEIYCDQHIKQRKLQIPETGGPHGRKMKCAGTTTRGKPCKSTGFSFGSATFYCSPHLDQKPESLPSSDSEDDDGGILITPEDPPDDAGCSLFTEEVSQLDLDQTELRVTPSDYEKASISHVHRIEMQCSGKAKKGKRCKTQGFVSSNNVSEFYCDAHSSQRPQALSQELRVPEQISNDMNSNEAYTVMPKPFDRGQQEALDLTSTGAVADALSVVLPVEEAPGNEEEEKNEEDDNVSISDTAPLVEATHTSESGHAASAATSDGERNERVPFGMSPDEVDVFSIDSSSEEDIPEHVQHLHDIVGSTSASDSESDDGIRAESFDEESFQYSNGDPKEWTWDLPIANRWRAAAALLHRVCEALSKLIVLADGYVQRARRERAEAAAYSYKNARLIGATVVGATRRLHALRASEPFAMVVEEACEVMEPTLVSVLAVRSVCKLELIGDHRQLPAFVQQCWFAVQMTHPSIKVSLFERLVTVGEPSRSCTEESACTILDVQRRMRPEICELTRCEYADLIQITDHNCTIKQRIGDRNMSSTLREERQLWEGNGSTVPGLKPQVFFWNLATTEGRAAVGLSRCNDGEAKACASLVSWLVYSGVPATAITIITPYKGQKITILKELRKRRGGNLRNSIERNGSRLNDVVVSTVDRYQGDENDIVILSLVCTRPGNRFVALRNRFIVAMSRARIGCYVVGAADAVTKDFHGTESPPHWRRMLTDLTVLKSTENTEIDECLSRISDKLTICCPRHSEVTRTISEASDFPQTPEMLAEFCSGPCPFLLPWCSHTCSLPCHSPTALPHTPRCEVRVERPCESHVDIPLFCYEVLNGTGFHTESLKTALEMFKCNVPVEYRRLDCSHSILLPCHQHVELLAGLFELQPCAEILEVDYVHPSCGHRRVKPKCYDFREWECTPPPCLQRVVHVRVCGCTARMLCHDSVLERSLEEPPQCREAVTKPRPRCSHLLTSRCYEASALCELWSQQNGDAVSSIPPIVEHGFKYGPSETALGKLHPLRFKRMLPPCHVSIEYRMRCDHIIIALCSEAFELAEGTRNEPQCKEDTNIASPICGHKIRTPCWVQKMSQTLPVSVCIEQQDDEGNLERVASESKLQAVSYLSPIHKELSRSCRRVVTILRNCGHRTTNVPCSRLFSIVVTKQLPPCYNLVRVDRSCGHAYDVQCHRQGEKPPICKAVVDDVFAYPCGKDGHNVRPGACDQLTQLRELVDPKCPITVDCIRARCTHRVSVACYLERNVTVSLPGVRLDPPVEQIVVEADIDYCEAAEGVKPCPDPVVYRRLCGHEETDIPCHLAFSWAACPDEAPPCQYMIEIDSPLCDHSLNIPCNQKEATLAFDPWKGMPPQRITQHFDGDAVTCPVVKQTGPTPSRPLPEISPYLRCGHTTRLQRSCGHEEDIPCASVFEKLGSGCRQLEVVVCDACQHEQNIPCFDLEGPHPCPNLVEKLCSICDINMTIAECFKEQASCEREVRAELPCKHKVTWTCGEDDPRVKLDTDPCLVCTKNQWQEALSMAKIFVDQNQPGSNAAQAEKRKRLANAAEARKTNGNNSVLTAISFDPVSLANDLRARVLEELPVSWIKSQDNSEPIAPVPLLSAYIEVLSCHNDLLSEGIANDSREGLTIRPPPGIMDAYGAYDIVYHVLTDDDPVPFNLVNTIYGFGARGTIFCTKALIADCSNSKSSSMISVCVAAALKHQLLEGAPPFRLEKKEIHNKFQEKKKLKKAAAKAHRKAQQLRQRHKEAGFDHVSRDAMGKPFERVYWITGAVVPLFKLDVQFHRECEICFDDVLPSKGWVCLNDHFLCRECFRLHVKHAREPDTSGRPVDKSGRVVCPHVGCQAVYEPVLLLSQPHDAKEEEILQLFSELQELRMAVRTKQEVETALDIQKRKLQGEFQRIQQIQDIDERQAELVRLDIIEHILTLRCPKKHCGMAFLDFEGCFALKCSNCQTNFCAWCIRFSAPDVHGHVLECQERTGNGLFHSLALFKEHHRSRRKKLVIERLSTETREVKKRALLRLQPELKDLQIQIAQDGPVTD